VQFGHKRYIYNWGIDQSRERYSGYKHLADQLPEMKRSEELSWLKAAHSQVLQQALIDLNKAFVNFFEKRAGYPHYKKSKHARQSIRFPQPGADWISTDQHRIKLPKVGWVKVEMHRPLEGVMKKVTVSRNKSGHYFVSINVEVEIKVPEMNGGQVGIDLGVRDFVTLSSGEKVEPPGYYRKAQRKRRRLARRLSRKKPGSRNREKARLKLARCDAHIANQRKDFHHRLSYRLVQEHRLIAMEDLHVGGMMANHRLAGSIGDAGWSAFAEMLEYKGVWYGCQVVKVDRWYPSSRRCSECGMIAERLPLSVRDWECPECSTTHDRDVNAAVNILKEATVGVTRRNACGQHVRPGTAAAAGQAGCNR
jgi:putative transposase